MYQFAGETCFQDQCRIPPRIDEFIKNPYLVKPTFYYTEPHGTTSFSNERKTLPAFMANFTELTPLTGFESQKRQVPDSG